MDKNHSIKDIAEKIFIHMISDSIDLKAEILIVDPIPILDERKNIRAWMIAVQSGDQLCGYIQLNEELEFLKYASFQRKSNSLEGCPLAQDWLDPKIIVEKAKSFAGKENHMAEPYLSFHNHISRLSWVVPSESVEKGKYNIFVVGDYVFNQ